LRINDFSNYKNIVAGTVPIGMRALHYLWLRAWSAFDMINRINMITFWPGFCLSRLWRDLIARRASPKGIKLGARTKMFFS